VPAFSHWTVSQVPRSTYIETVNGFCRHSAKSTRTYLMMWNSRVGCTRADKQINKCSRLILGLIVNFFRQENHPSHYKIRSTTTHDQWNIYKNIHIYVYVYT
jgi:hypothetical protein